MRLTGVFTALLILLTSTAFAGLPQPMFVYYGLAKDGFGIPYREKAEVLLLSGSTAVARHTITGSIVPGVNFALYAHLDDGRGSSTYTSKAVRTGDPISIVIRDAYGQQTILEHASVPLCRQTRRDRRH